MLLLLIIMMMIMMIMIVYIYMHLCIFSLQSIMRPLRHVILLTAQWTGWSFIFFGSCFAIELQTDTSTLV